MNDGDNSMHKYYAPFLSSKNHEDESSGSEYNSAKRRVCHQNKDYGFFCSERHKIVITYRSN